MGGQLAGLKVSAALGRLVVGAGVGGRAAESGAIWGSGGAEGEEISKKNNCDCLFSKKNKKTTNTAYS